MARFASFEDYTASIPEDRRPAIRRIRDLAVTAAPGAVETISYDMPALRLDGRFLVSWSAFQRHVSLFPASAAVVQTLGDEITPYLAGRGTIRFPADLPIPEDLVTRIVLTRVSELRDGG